MKITAYKNREILILSLALGLIFFGFNGAEQHFTAFYQQIGLKNLAFQALAILYGAIAIGNLIGPSFVYKLGGKLALIFGFTTYIALVFGMVTKIPLLIYLLSFCLGIGAGVAGVGRVEFLYLISPIKNRGEYAGAIDSLRTFGGFMGVLSVSVLLIYLNLDKIFILLGFVMLLGLVLMFKLKNLTSKNLNLENKSWKLMGKLLLSPKILLFVPYYVSGGLLLGLVLGAIPAYIEKNFGIIWVGIITSLFHLTLALVLLLAGYLSDIKGRFVLIYASILTELLGSLIFLNFAGLPVYGLVMILLGLGQSLSGGALSALMLDTFEQDIKEASAVLGTLGIILGIVPSFLLPQILGQNQMFSLAISITLVGMFCLFIFQRLYGQKS